MFIKSPIGSLLAVKDSEVKLALGMTSSPSIADYGDRVLSDKETRTKKNLKLRIFWPDGPCSGANL